MKPPADPSSPTDSSDQRLDQLLAWAQWPQPDSECELRLRRQWLALRGRYRMWQTAGLLAAAATIVLVVTLAWRTVPRSNPHDPTRLAMPGSVTKVKLPSPQWREPTLQERLVLPPRGKAKSDVSASLPTLEQALENLAKDPSPRSLAVALSTLRSSGRSQGDLARLTTDGNHPRALGAARLLAQIGDRGAMPALQNCLNSPQLRDVALPGVLRLGTPDELRSLALKHPQPRTRHQLIAALFSGRDPRAVQLFLQLILDLNTREDALAAVRQIDVQSAAPALLRALDHPRVDYRFAAARALGELCPHGLGPRLQRMVEQNDHAREALAALIFCEDRTVSEYLATAARRRPVIESQLRVVKLELRRLFDGEGT